MTLAIVLLFAGLVLVVAELVFPSLGLLSVAAAACLIAAVSIAFARDTQTGIALLVATVVLVPCVLVFGFKWLPKSPLGRWIVNPGASFTDTAAVDMRDRSLIGVEGVAESFLRPAGTVRLGGRRVDVVTRGEPIDAGTLVRVIEVEGNRVVVARSAAASGASTTLGGHTSAGGSSTPAGGSSTPTSGDAS